MDGETRRQKRRINKAKLRRFALMAGCVYLLVMMVGVFVNQEKSRAIQREDYDQLAAQLEDAHSRNEELERKISFAETNAYVERVARDQLGYVREGEIKFIAENEGIVPDVSDDGGSSAQDDAGLPGDSGQSDDPEAASADDLDWEDGFLPGLPEGATD